MLPILLFEALWKVLWLSLVALPKVASGDLDLAEEIQDVTLYLSIGIASVINILNPPTIFLHGRLFDLSDDFFGRLVEEVRRRALRPLFAECRFARAGGNKRQGAVAAILDHLIESWAPRTERPRRTQSADV